MTPPSSHRRADVGRSRELKKRAASLIPGCTQTNSKRPGRWVQGVSPAFLERAAGSHVWDVDGNEYVDYLMACGPVILGHNDATVVSAVEAQLGDGVAYSMPHPLEVEVAAQLTELVPCAEMVRFGKNGSDVTSAAARLARAHTGRDVIATHGYHGWPDVWAAASGSNGVPDAVESLTVSFDFNDIESVERIFEDHPDDVAAIVTTPMVWDEPEDDFLGRLRDLASDEGSLLVFDEVITGFRFAPGGAQEYFGVTPDLACFAKAMANGHPISALAGRADVMERLDDDVTFSLTYGGEALSLAASNAALSILRDGTVQEHLFTVGSRLRDGYNAIAAEHGLDDRTACRGLAPFTTVTFQTDAGETDANAQSLFMQECHRAGVLFSSCHLPSFSHSATDVDYTLDVYRSAMETVATAIDDGTVEKQLEGLPIGSQLSV